MAYLAVCENLFAYQMFIGGKEFYARLFHGKQFLSLVCRMTVYTGSLGIVNINCNRNIF